MNTKEITEALDWTEEEYKELLEKKKKKANALLYRLIHKQDEEGALLLLFDKTLEVNADIHQQDYSPLNVAIKTGLLKLIKECYQNPLSKYKLNINRKNNKNFYESLAQSNNVEIYEFFEEMKKDKIEMLASTLFYALGSGKLNLIKYLINKKIDNESVPVDFQRAIMGYFYGNMEDKNLYEYTSFFANIEKNTDNSYINEESKKIFFNSNLLDYIIRKQDEESLDLYKSIISSNQMIKDLASVLRKNDEQITDNESRIIDGLKWFLTKEAHLDFKDNKTIELGFSRSKELQEYYQRIVMNKKFNEQFPSKEDNQLSEKKMKI